jgi:hypothetical protein
LTKISNRFSYRGLWTLFLVVAFPIHIWAFLMFFEDYAWIARRTNAWDAIGVGAYGLVIAFIESVFVFLCAVLLSLFLPKKWTEAKRTALMGWLVWLTAIWAILGQLHFIWDPPIPHWIYTLLAGQAHPARIVYGLFFGLALVTILLPVYGIVNSVKFTKITLLIFERVSILTVLYLLLDFMGLVVVVVRNV